MLWHPVKDPSRYKIAKNPTKPKYWMWSAKVFYLFRTAHEGHNPAVQNTHLSVLLNISEASVGIVIPALTRYQHWTSQKDNFLLPQCMPAPMFRSHMHIPSTGLLKPLGTGPLSTESLPGAGKRDGSRKNCPRVAILGSLFYQTCMFSDVQRGSWGYKRTDAHNLKIIS